MVVVATLLPQFKFLAAGVSGAAATPIISNGQIIAIRIDSGGQGYTSPPTVTITSNGSGATAQATMSVQISLKERMIMFRI